VKKPTEGVLRAGASPLARLNRVSDEIVSAVSERVLQDRLSGGVQADALAQEVSDSAGLLAQTAPPKDRGRWEAMLEEVGSADVTALGAMLGTILTHYGRGIVGRFHPATHRVVAAVASAMLQALFRPPGRLLERRSRLAFDGPMDTLRELASQGTLLFVPTHSSNLDGFVFGVSLAQAQLPPCAYAGGKHMLRKPLIRRIVTGAGGYTVDRANHLPLYKDTLKAFSAILLEQGAHSVVFAGATRCRSNEVEKQLKLGLLSTAFRAARNLQQAGDPRPIHVVPVTLNYQVVPEASVLIRFFLQGRAEERIFDEPGQGPGGGWRLLRRFRVFDGCALTRFGTPIEVVAQSDERGDGPAVRELGARIRAAHRRQTVFMGTHIVGRAIFDLASARLRGDPPPAELVAQLEAEVLEFDPGRVRAAVRATVALIDAQPEHGQVHDRIRDMEPLEMVDEALQSWHSGHDSKVVVQTEGRYRVADAALLLYYRNRTSHLHQPRGSGGREDPDRLFSAAQVDR
jgi:glycerol-3-phosphate O-acyltransferase